MDDAPPSKRVKVESANPNYSNTTTIKTEPANASSGSTSTAAPRSSSSASSSASSSSSDGANYMELKELQIKDNLCPGEPMSLVNNYVYKVLAVEKQIAHRYVLCPIRQRQKQTNTHQLTQTTS